VGVRRSARRPDDDERRLKTNEPAARTVDRVISRRTAQTSTRGVRRQFSIERLRGIARFGRANGAVQTGWLTIEASRAEGSPFTSVRIGVRQFRQCCIGRRRIHSIRSCVDGEYREAKYHVPRQLITGTLRSWEIHVRPALPAKQRKRTRPTLARNRPQTNRPRRRSSPSVRFRLAPAGTERSCVNETFPTIPCMREFWAWIAHVSWP
jgi:hypothetical protein